MLNKLIHAGLAAGILALTAGSAVLRVLGTVTY
jgi:hypothetical protein